MLERIRMWAHRHGHNSCRGYVCIFNDLPFRYSRDIPAPRTVTPGVTCMNIATGRVITACGGGDQDGAKKWAKPMELVA